MEERDLWRAVMEHPDTDAPRLVYADWLLDRGDPRGEFIVLQCRLETLSASDPARAPIARRATELHDQYCRDWYPDAGGAALEYRRGFPWGATADIADDPLALLERVPIRQLTLTCRSTRDRLALAHRIAVDPRLARLARLVLDVGWGEQAFAALMGGPHWGALRALAIRGADSRQSSVDVIAAADLVRLHGLELDGTAAAALDDRPASFSAPGLGRLRRLRLRNVGLDPVAARSLASAPYLTELVELDLGGRGEQPHANRIGAEGALALARSRNFRDLHRLVLDGNRIGSVGLTELAHSSGFPELRELSLQSNEIDDGGLRALAVGAAAPQLERLDLARNFGIGSQGVAVLTESPGMRRVAALGLERCPIGPIGARALVRSPWARGFRDLDLSSCSLRNDGAFELAQSPALLELERLRVAGNGIHGEGAAMLRARFSDRVQLDMRDVMRDVAASRRRS